MTGTTIDPDVACEHLNFIATVKVNRLTVNHGDTAHVEGYSADITVGCEDCGEPFRWIGPPIGVSPAQPMVSADRTELRAPLRPESSELLGGDLR